ncbi:MAG: hypothetical protein SXV54_03095 [Chloroflexota bacterium]|nr:hypothetical protein [Chloroflexota bacterium]
MSKKLLSAAFALLLATLLGGCQSNGVAPTVTRPARSMKGFELYSWQAEGKWRFALVVGTNRIKTFEEIASPDVCVEGLDALWESLDQLAGGEQVFWSGGRVPNTVLPPDDMLEQVRAYCAQRGIHLTIQADDARWDPSPTALIVRYYSPHTNAGLAGAYDHRYYIPKVQVWGDGRIIWVQREGARRRVLEGHLTTDQMKALLQRILEAGFFDWKDEYYTLGGNSYPPMHLSVSLIGRSFANVEVSEHGGAPDAYYELVGFLTSGAGAAGDDYAPERGYLTAAQEPTEADVPQWPDAAAGIALDQARDGRYVEGEALSFAWQMVNENPRAPVYVRSKGQVYSIVVQIPGVSFFEPPPQPTGLTTRTPAQATLEPLPTITPESGVTTPYCRPNEASVDVSASPTTLEVGQTVSVTVILTNGDTTDVKLGLIQYSLAVRPSHVLTSDNLGPVEHPLSLEPGQSDETEFVLRAATPGRATLTGSTSFEIHALDYSWGSWSGCHSWPLEIVVMPAVDTG